jgi:hypothetical protein
MLDIVSKIPALIKYHNLLCEVVNYYLATNPSMNKCHNITSVNYATMNLQELAAYLRSFVIQLNNLASVAYQLFRKDPTIKANLKQAINNFNSYLVNNASYMTNTSDCDNDPNIKKYTNQIKDYTCTSLIAKELKKIDSFSIQIDIQAIRV